MDNRGQMQIIGVALAALTFILVFAIYGAVQASLNMDVFSVGVQNLINLLPMALLGVAIIGFIVVSFRLME